MSRQVILPGATIGIVGGGQLGQMLALSAIEMGYHVNILDPNPACPAANIATKFICSEYDSRQGLNLLAKSSDVLTYEFENISAMALNELETPYYLPQGTKLLEMTQSRANEKSFLQELKLPIASFQVITNVKELTQATHEIGYPCVLKTVTGGYDGKGQVVLNSSKDIETAAVLLKQRCVLEEWLTFDREISVIVAGNPQGEYVTFPCGENIHQDNILHQTIVPARITNQLLNQATKIALKIAKASKLVGVLAIEMFVVGQDIYINELAPRPHNSGHYSIEACDFSQFDLHVKGVCGLPLCQPVLLSPVVMTNILGQHVETSVENMLNEPTWHFHFYGKSASNHGRKMGHVTVLTDNIECSLTSLALTHIWHDKGDK